MDAYVAIASKREVRDYADRPLPDDVVHRILEAGRVSGSSQNKQPWRFVLVESTRDAVAGAVYETDNIRGAALVVGIVVSGRGPLSFDAGRTAQNMMLAAWNEGVGSCPNGVADAASMAGALGISDEEKVAIVLSFGYPARPVDPERRSAAEWIERAARKPLDEIITRV
jgi:nitroreductase